MSVWNARPHRAASILAGVVLLTGCFAGGSGENTDTGRLALGLGFAPVAAMSPYSDDAALLGRIGATETLLRLDAEGDPQPHLAESWTEVDDSTLRLTVRDDVTFHDGTELTAEHAAAALTHATQAAPLPRALAGVELSATATGPHTLQVSTAEPDPILRQRLSSPELTILAPDAYTDPASPNPVRAGTGPYVLTDVAGTSGATLRPNTEYWNGRPRTPGIDVRFIPDGASRAAALRAGEVDLIDVVPVTQLDTITEHEIVEIPLPRVVGAHLNTESGPFTDPGMRAAAGAAVDPTEIAEGVYEGHADPARGLFGPASPWSRESSGDDGPEPAAPEGAAITVATYSDRPELPEVASVIAADLEQAGFTVERTVVQEYSTLETDLLEGTYDLVVGARSYGLDTGDPVSYLTSDYTCDGSYNLSQVCDPDLDARIHAAAAETEVSERVSAATEIADELLARGVIVPLVHERTRLGMAPRVEGVAEDPFERRLVTVDTTLVE